MRFETLQERLDLIESFKNRAKELEEEKKNEKGLDKNFNCKVIFDTRTEYDEDVEVLETLEFVPKPLIKCEVRSEKCSGDIYVFYIRQPKLLDSIKILEAGDKENKVYSKCLIAWDAMIDTKNSSPEIFTDRIKLGYLPNMINHIDVLAGDQKKR